MFEELIREVNQLSQPREFQISVPLDDKGYYDRLCHNDECGALFKVSFEDWRDKVQDEKVFCPFCRHEAPSDNWHTSEQEEHIRSAALAEMTKLVHGALRRGVQRSRPTTMDAGLFKLNMSLSFQPGSIPAVVPAEARDEFRQDFICESCGCRYASVGASFFCPACGHNSAVSTFDNTLTTVQRTVAVASQLRATLETTADPDTAKDAIRQILEDQYARLVGAFERFNEALFGCLPNAPSFPKKGNVFQRIDDASALWQQASGKSYGDFLSSSELSRLRISVQRRHVLSHGQGIVDQAYIAKSGDTTYQPGQRLVVRESDVLEFAQLLQKLASGLKSLVPP